MKDRRLELRLSKREYDRLYVLAAADPDCRMKSGRPSLSAYVRRHIIWSGNDPDDLRREMRSLTYQIRKAGVNINQAVHRINAGNSRWKDIDAIRRNQSRIEGLLSQILDLMQENLTEGQ